MSSSARWVVAVIFAVVGVLALVVAVIYLTVPIHSIPSFMPGKRSVGGTYHKRGALVAVVGIVLLAIAAFVGLGARRSAGASVGSAGDSTESPMVQGATSGEPEGEGDQVRP
jgi:uncharacterized membrane protein